MTAPSAPCVPLQHRGMTLIEVLVSILILSLGLLGLVGLQARASAISAGAEDSNKAALLGNEIATALVLNTPAGGQFDPASGPPAPATAAAATAASQVPNGVATITFDSPKQATILITWKPPSAASAAASSNYRTQVVLP